MTTPLTFEPEAHVYRWRGAVVPSVTQILKDLGLSPNYPEDRGWLQFGRDIHRCCELVLRDRLESCGAVYLPYVEAFRDFVKTYRVEPINTEMQVYHSTLGYAGTLDLNCRLFGKDEATVDYKTGVPPECVGLQLAGYEMALASATGRKFGLGQRRRFSLRLLTDETKQMGKAKLVEYTDPFDYQAFEGAVNVWKWRFGRNRGGQNGK